MINIFIQVLLICVCLQFVAWLWQNKTKNADIVDITWALGIVITSLYYYFTLCNYTTVSLWMLIFPGLWYLRLSFHLIKRYRVQHEDSRYAYLRNHWQVKTKIKFFFFFQFQAVLIWIFVLPAYWLRIVPFELNAKMFFGFTIGLISFVGVTISDQQLYHFKSTNQKNKVCEIGFWKYSRHPNYFFEWLHWFIYPILLINTPYFYWALLYLILMLIFLLKLTGIPFSEQQSLINRGDSYRDYQNRTNKFFPWKPKK